MKGLQFLKPRENLIFLGSVGTGKTHLATAIALAACQAGRRVRFFTAASLANLLLERNNKGTLNSFQENLKRVDLIVVDEIGFVPLHKESAELLFQVMCAFFGLLDFQGKLTFLAEREGRGSGRYVHNHSAGR